MSFYEGDPKDFFNSILSGPEPASEMDLQELDSIARSIIRNETAEIVKSTSIASSDNMSFLIFDTMNLENADTFSPHTVISLEDESDERLFSVIYDNDNSLIDVIIPSEERFLDAIHACDNLIETGGLDPLTSAVANYLKERLTEIYTEDSISGLFLKQETEEIEGNTERHVADISRRIVNLRTGFQYVRVIEYSKQISINEELTIVHHAPFEYDDPDDIPDVLDLQVSLDRINEGLTYHYSSDKETRKLEVFSHNPTDESLETTDDDDPLKDFWVPQVKDVTLLTEAMMEVVIMQELGIGSATDNSDLFIPTNFQFNEARFFDSNNEFSLDNTTTEVIRSINNHPSSDRLPIINYNQKRQERINKFLLQTVKADNGEQERRSRIFDVHLACQQILDEIEQYDNHPVAQALSELYVDYDDTIGTTNVQKVITEVIKAAYPTKLRERFIKHSNAWRVGELAISN